MANRYHSSSGWQILLLLLVLGGIAGGWIGDALIRAWPVLSVLGKVQNIGLPNFILDLHVFTLNFGFMFYINFFTILGFIVAYLIYRRI